jgi:siroheme synthase-like protein
MANRYIPLNFSLIRRTCLIVGGGDVALRKIENLLDYESDITVIAPDSIDKIQYFADNGKIKLVKREYKSADVKKYGIVIAASDNNDINKTVHDDCRKTGIPVNVVDNPDLCDFTFPAVLKRGKLSVAVSTDGRAPFLAAQLRVILENIFPSRWKRIADYAGKFRDDVLNRWGDDSQKKAECFNHFLQADWKAILKEKSEEDIQSELDRMLEGGIPEEIDEENEDK